MSDAQPQNEIMDVALRAHEAGLCVLPPKQDGSKRPLTAWEKYANTSSTLEEVHDWYSGNRTGIGLVLGAASGGVECFEFDDMDTFHAFLDRMDELGHTDLYRKIEAGCSEKSPNGIHWFYKCSVVSGNTKLARRPKTADEKSSEHDNVKVLIETRGQGGYAIVAPSHGSVHPSGQPYERLEGGFDSVATITPEERETIWSVARSFDTMTRSPVESEPERVSHAPSPVPPNPSSSDRPGDWFNRTKTWPEVLEPAGWTWVEDHGVESFWRRPGKGRDHSATTNYQGTDVLKCFSSSTPFDPEKSYTKFAAYAVLFHNGDFKSAARTVFPEIPKADRHLELFTDPTRRDSYAPSDDVPVAGGEVDPMSQTDAPRPGDSWKPVDLTAVLSGEAVSIVPTMLAREDGVLLLYPERIHEIKGQPEAGKGWLALLACKQVMRAGGTVMYIDFEDYEDGIVERLLCMGVGHEVIQNQFIYFHPEESFGDEAKKIVFGVIRERKPQVCIIDSVAEVMASNALNPLDNADAATFITEMPRPIANLGVAVILIDHVTKAADGNNRYSVGAQHKLAAVSGSSFVVEAENPLGIGMKGSSRLTVVKDRPGRVRKHAEGGKLMGRLIIHSNEDGSMTEVRIEKPLSMTIDGMAASVEVMGDVAEYVEAQGRRGPSVREIRAAVEGRNEAIDLALETLVDSGFFFREPRAGRGGGFAYISLRPYRA